MKRKWKTADNLQKNNQQPIGNPADNVWDALKYYFWFVLWLSQYRKPKGINFRSDKTVPNLQFFVLDKTVPILKFFVLNMPRESLVKYALNIYHSWRWIFPGSGRYFINIPAFTLDWRGYFLLMDPNIICGASTNGISPSMFYDEHSDLSIIVFNSPVCTAPALSPHNNSFWPPWGSLAQPSTQAIHGYESDFPYHIWDVRVKH